MPKYQTKLIKVGIGTFDRPDTLRGKDWEIVRFGHFSNRESARNAESKVLSYWRNDLGMSAPERAKALLKSGHTETVESSVGINKAWAIITSSANFIPLISKTEQEILDKYNHFFERGKLIWDDQLFWAQIHKTWYGSIETKFYQLSNKVDSQKHIREDSKMARSQLRAFGKEFQAFMNLNHAILARVSSLKQWEPASESQNKPMESKNPTVPRVTKSRVAGTDEVSRFWKRVEKSENCWQWTGTKNPSGYGLATFEDRLQPAHRVTWKLEFGECAPEVFLDNKCGNRSCVKTAHWEISDRRKSRPGEIRVSPFICTTSNCEKPSVTMTVAGLCDSCRQRAKRERRKLREAQGGSEQEIQPESTEE